MKLTLIFALLGLTLLLGCSDKQPQKDEVKNNDNRKHSNHFEISAIDGKLPLHLDELNLDDKNNSIQLNDGIVTKIEQVIRDYAKDFQFYDSTQSFKDTYINTIRLHDSLQTIFLVLLKHYPTGELNTKVLFYDNQKKEFSDTDFDFNIWALYNFENGKLIPSKLKKDFKITSPEIEVVDVNKDGVNDFKFVRLWHNGTFNAIHTIILTVKKSKIDTLHFDEKPIGNEELLQGRK